MTCRLQSWVGAYVLDALEPDESETLRQHIAECAICQDEVVGLAWIPTMLRAVAPDGVERIDEDTEDTGDTGDTCGQPADHRPPPVMLERLLASMDADKRSRRLGRPAAILVAVAMVVAIAGAATIGGGAFNGPHRPPAASAIQAVDPHTKVDAAVTMTSRTWGTELHLTLSWVAPGEQCSLVAHSRDGRSDVAATWTASYQGTASVPGTTAIAADQLSELDVVAANGQQLVRLVVPHKTK